MWTHFPVLPKQVLHSCFFSSLSFFIYFVSYCTVDVTDSYSCIITYNNMLMMSESKLAAHPGASPLIAALSFCPIFWIYFTLCLSSLHHSPRPLSSSHWCSALNPKISELHLLISAAALSSFPCYFLFNFLSHQHKFYLILNEYFSPFGLLKWRRIFLSPSLCPSLLFQMGTSILNAHSAMLVPISPVGLQIQSTGHQLKHSISLPMLRKTAYKKM